MFDLSMPQLAGLGLVAYLLFGKRDVVSGANVLGRALGKNVVRVQYYRDNFSTAFTDEGLKSLHPELRRGFSSFMEVQNEIKAASVNPVHSMQRKLASHVV